MKVTGTVTRFNQTPGKAAGIQINNTWYNATPGTENFVKETLVGKNVELTTGDDDNKIMFIKDTEALSGDLTHPDVVHTNIHQSKNKVLGVTVGMAINNATLRVNSLPNPVTNEAEWARRVTEYADALIKEMEKQQW